MTVDIDYFEPQDRPIKKIRAKTPTHYGITAEVRLSGGMDRIVFTMDRGAGLGGALYKQDAIAFAEALLSLAHQLD